MRSVICLTTWKSHEARTPSWPSRKRLPRPGCPASVSATSEKLAKFGRKSNPAEAEAFDRAGVSWRDADRIYSKHLTSAFGRKLPSTIVGSKVKPGDIGKAITKASVPEARETLRAVTTAGTRARRAIRLLGKIAERSGADEDIREEARREVQALALMIKAILR